jgi:hypothetical protein
MATLTNIFNYDPSADIDFADLTARIRPLPSNVTPSERFVEQMRLRLLALKPEKSSTRAA